MRFRHFYMVYVLFLVMFNINAYPDVINVAVTLSNIEILSGESVDLLFEVHNNHDKPISVLFWGKCNRDDNEFQICVLDSEGNIVHNRRILKAYPASQKIVYHGRILPSETILFTYPIQLQVFTDLPIGSYAISPMQLSFRVGIIGDGPHIKKSVSVDIPKIPFKIIDNNQTRLYDIFKELEQKALCAEQREFVSWVGMDFLDIWPKSRTLLWAYGPMAVDAQIALIYDNDKGFRFWPPATIHAWDNIARHANPEQVKKLIEIIDSEKFKYDKSPSQDYDPGIVWCFHEIAKSGTDENKALARPIAEKYENNIGFKSMEYGTYPYGN